MVGYKDHLTLWFYLAWIGHANKIPTMQFFNEILLSQNHSYAIIDGVCPPPGIPKECIVGYSLTCPIEHNGQWQWNAIKGSVTMVWPEKDQKASALSLMITLFRRRCGPLSADILCTEKFAFSVVAIMAFLVPESLACRLVDSNYW